MSGLGACRGVIDALDSRPAAGGADPSGRDGDPPGPIVDELHAGHSMAQGIAATERSEVSPRAVLIRISLEPAAAAGARDGGQLAVPHGHQGSKRVWLLEHGSALRALNADW